MKLPVEVEIDDRRLLSRLILDENYEGAALLMPFLRLIDTAVVSLEDIAPKKIVILPDGPGIPRLAEKDGVVTITDWWGHFRVLEMRKHSAHTGNCTGMTRAIVCNWNYVPCLRATIVV